MYDILHTAMAANIRPAMPETLMDTGGVAGRFELHTARWKPVHEG